MIFHDLRFFNLFWVFFIRRLKQSGPKPHRYCLGNDRKLVDKARIYEVQLAGVVFFDVGSFIGG